MSEPFKLPDVTLLLFVVVLWVSCFILLTVSHVFFSHVLSSFLPVWLLVLPKCVVPVSCCCEFKHLFFLPIFLCQLMWISLPTVSACRYQQAWLNLACTFHLPFILHCGSFSSSVHGTHGFCWFTSSLCCTSIVCKVSGFIDRRNNWTLSNWQWRTTNSD